MSPLTPPPMSQLRLTHLLRPMLLILLIQDHSQAQHQLLLRMLNTVHLMQWLKNGRLIKSKRNLKMLTKLQLTKPQLPRSKLNQTPLTLTIQSHSLTQLQSLLLKLKRAILQTKSQLRRSIQRLPSKLNPALRPT